MSLFANAPYRQLLFLLLLFLLLLLLPLFGVVGVSHYVQAIDHKSSRRQTSRQQLRKHDLHPTIVILSVESSRPRGIHLGAQQQLRK